MDDKQLARQLLGAQAVGMLRGLLRCGALINWPANAALAKSLCDEWDAAMYDDPVAHRQSESGSALPRPGSENPRINPAYDKEWNHG